MNLTTDSRLVKWAYSWDSGPPPAHTNLCVLVWKAVLVALAYAGMTVSAGYILHLLYLGVTEKFTAPTLDDVVGMGLTALVIVGGAAVVIGAISLLVYLKVNYCPLVQIGGGRSYADGRCPRCVSQWLVIDEDGDWACEECGGVFVLAAEDEATA